MTAKQDILDPLLTRMVTENISDLMLETGTGPLFNIRGHVIPTGTDAFDSLALDEFMGEILGAEPWENFLITAGTTGIDGQLTHEGQVFNIRARPDKNFPVLAAFGNLRKTERPVFPAVANA